MEDLAKTSEGNSKLEDLSVGEEVIEGKIACAHETVEEELWLERFGGPRKSLKVAGGGTVVLREEGFLRVLI